MQNIKRTMIQAVVCAALGVTALSAYARNGYVIDSSGAVVRNNFGDCWRTNSWKVEDAFEDCDKDLIPKKKEEPKVEAPKKEAPAPEAAKPAPAPAPAPKKVETISLNASGLFEFNKAILKEEGKQSLSDVAGILLERKYDETKTKIEVLGHTDRIGKEAYNQKLSEERAAAAKDFLISKGVPTAIISSAGKGFSAPVTRPEDCKKVLKNRKKLIECYAPDRRVDIEIYATRDAL